MNDGLKTKAMYARDLSVRGVEGLGVCLSFVCVVFLSDSVGVCACVGYSGRAIHMVAARADAS